MKKLIASILCLVMVLASISALAALPLPDASQKPAAVTVSITKDDENHLVLTVSDGGKDYSIHGSFMIGTNSSTYTSFSWNEEKKAYVSYYTNANFTGEYRYVDVNSYLDNGKTIYRQIGGSVDNYSTYVQLYEYTNDTANRTRTSSYTTWYAEGNAQVEKTVYVSNEKGDTVSNSNERTYYDKNGKMTSDRVSETEYEYAEDGGHTEKVVSKETNNNGDVTDQTSTRVYDKDYNQISYVSESKTHDKDGNLTRESKFTRDKDGNEVDDYTYYSAQTGKMTSKRHNTWNQDGSYSNTYESYTSEGVLTYKSVSASDGKTATSSTENYYDDGSLQYKTSSKRVTEDDKTTVTGDRYNSSNTLVFAYSGTETETEDGTSKDITYTNASGTTIGWDRYDAKTGKTESRLPNTSRTYVYTFGADADYGTSSNSSLSAYANSGDVQVWREYSYDPETGKATELITNYKGLKIYESSTTLGDGTSRNYWLRTQVPYIVTTTDDDKTTESYQSVKGLELMKSVSEDSTQSFYNSNGDLTYKYENGKYYVNNNGELQELEAGISVMPSTRNNVYELSKYESIENGYKSTYYDLDMNLVGSYVSTTVTNDNVTTRTTIDYDADGKETSKNVTVTTKEDTEKGTRTTIAKNDIVTQITENITEDDGTSREIETYYDADTGIITRSYEYTWMEGSSKNESRYYDSIGNLDSVYKRESQANGYDYEYLDKNEALTSYGTSSTVNGHSVTTEHWAVGPLAYTSDWYWGGLSMTDGSVGTSSNFDENGRYTYWTTRDENGNETTWNYRSGDKLSSIVEITYNEDGSRSTHRQYFDEDGVTSGWYYVDETEDGLYTTANRWDENGTLLWTRVTEATKEGQTTTTTDTNGNKRVVTENYATGEYNVDKNYTSEDGWKYVFGAWKYIEDNDEVYGWKNIGGNWYYFNTDMAEYNIALYDYDAETKEDVLDAAYVFSADGVWVSTPGWYMDEDGDYSYVQADGTAATGWQNIGGTWYYFNDYGYMRTGDVTLDGYTYHLNDDGAWITLNGWVENENSGFWNHYTNDVLDTGWFNDGNWYYLSGQTGSMVTNAWLELDDKWYLFDESGAMATGWTEKNGIWYYFEGDGSLADGWVQSGDTYYYMTESGMATGWQVIDGNWEYFNEDGTWSYTWGPVEE